jgi:hypothetical protein
MVLWPWAVTLPTWVLIPGPWWARGGPVVGPWWAFVGVPLFVGRGPWSFGGGSGDRGRWAVGRGAQAVGRGAQAVGA